MSLQLRQETKIIACPAPSTASRGPSGTGPSSAIMADAVTSVGAIRAGDTITYTDHFGGDSEGPVSTAILTCRFRPPCNSQTTAVAAHRKGAEAAGRSGRRERRERPSGASWTKLALRNGHFVHQNDVSKIGKSARSFLDPIFDVETDFSLQFGVRAHPGGHFWICLLYTSPSPRDRQKSRMPSSA